MWLIHHPHRQPHKLRSASTAPACKISPQPLLMPTRHHPTGRHTNSRSASTAPACANSDPQPRRMPTHHHPPPTATQTPAAPPPRPPAQTPPPPPPWPAAPCPPARAQTASPSPVQLTFRAPPRTILARCRRRVQNLGMLQHSPPSVLHAARTMQVVRSGVISTPRSSVRCHCTIHHGTPSEISWPRPFQSRPLQHVCHVKIIPALRWNFIVVSAQKLTTSWNFSKRRATPCAQTRRSALPILKPLVLPQHMIVPHKVQNTSSRIAP